MTEVCEVEYNGRIYKYKVGDVLKHKDGERKYLISSFDGDFSICLLSPPSPDGPERINLKHLVNEFKHVNTDDNEYEGVK